MNAFHKIADAIVDFIFESIFLMCVLIFFTLVARLFWYVLCG